MVRHSSPVITDPTSLRDISGWYNEENSGITAAIPSSHQRDACHGLVTVQTASVGWPPAQTGGGGAGGPCVNMDAGLCMGDVVRMVNKAAWR